LKKGSTLIHGLDAVTYICLLDSGVDEFSSKNERERYESRARINRDKSSQEDRERERARLKERRRKYRKIVLNNAVKSSESRRR